MSYQGELTQQSHLSFSNSRTSNPSSDHRRFYWPGWKCLIGCKWSSDIKILNMYLSPWKEHQWLQLYCGCRESEMLKWNSPVQPARCWNGITQSEMLKWNGPAQPARCWNGIAQSEMLKWNSPVWTEILKWNRPITEMWNDQNGNFSALCKQWLVSVCVYICQVISVTSISLYSEWWEKWVEK